VFVDMDGSVFSVRDVTMENSLIPVVEAETYPPGFIAPDEPSINVREEQVTGSKSYEISPESPSGDMVFPADLITAVLFVEEQAPPDSRVFYNSEHGLGWEDQRGWTVYLGETNDLQMKMQVYESILQRLKEQDTRPTMISVEFVHSPYIRLE
jgi:hypothetical protein